MKQFQKNNQSFVCNHCGVRVPPHPSSSRDHCPFCLYGLHVDINPGDRKNPCKGLLKPMGIKRKNNKTQILYQCISCGEKVSNITAPDDNKKKIIAVSANPV